mgnify:CR=1 FL=1
MKLFKRGALLAAMAVASVALMAGAASAGISPDPYTGSGDSGSFVTRTALGTSTCNLSNITGQLDGKRGGADGVITGLTISGCGGVILSATSLTRAADPISVDLDAGVVRVDNVRVLVTTIFGTCLYSGSLTGTWSSPTSTIRVSNPSFPLDTQLFGLCSGSADVTLTVNTAATITNP